MSVSYEALLEKAQSLWRSWDERERAKVTTKTLRKALEGHFGLPEDGLKARKEDLGKIIELVLQDETSEAPGDGQAETAPSESLEVETEAASAEMQQTENIDDVLFGGAIDDEPISAAAGMPPSTDQTGETSPTSLPVLPKEHRKEKKKDKKKVKRKLQKGKSAAAEDAEAGSDEEPAEKTKGQARLEDGTGLVFAEGGSGTATLPVPSVRHPNSELVMFKLPNVIGIDAREFDPDVWSQSTHGIGMLDDDGKLIKDSKLTAENVMRWRYTRDEFNNRIRQSNARIVEWPDGSRQLYLGSEVFDVEETHEPAGNSLLYTDSKSQRNLIKMCHGVVTGRMKFRPLSLDTVSHVKLKEKIAEQHVKVPKIRRDFAEIDPVKQQLTEQSIERELELKQKKAAKMKEKRSGPKRRKTKMTPDFLETGGEEEEADEAEAQFALSTVSTRKVYDEDEEEEKSERLKKIKREEQKDRKPKKNAEKNEDAKEEEAEEPADAEAEPPEDEPEEEEPVVRKKQKASARQLADEEEE